MLERMGRGALLALLAALSAFGQFQDLATTDDGAHLYFSSSLRLRGAALPPHLKIFRYLDSHFELFDQRNFEPIPGFNKTDFYQLVRPSVSGGSTVVAFTAVADCYGGSACVFFERYQGNVRQAFTDRIIQFPGNARVSRNGRYILQFGGTGYQAGNWLNDLSTGAARQIQGGFVLSASARQPLASNGAVLLSDSLSDKRQLLLWRQDGVQKLPNSEAIPVEAVIDDRAAIVVYESAGFNTERKLLLIDVASGRETRLALGPRPDSQDQSFQPWFRPMLSNDGRWLLYTGLDETSGVKQVFLARTDGSGRQQLTREPEDISEAILSGNGNLVYAVSRLGRLLRISVSSGQTAELIPRTPSVAYLAGAQVRGSLNWLFGTALADSTAVAQPPLPAELAQVQVKLNDRPLPLLLVSPQEIRYQIPWDAAIGLENSLELISGNSPFENVPLRPRFEDNAPAFIRLSQPNAIAAHQNFEGLVTPESPARPGEIIHFYMTGLGSVDPPVPTGWPAPPGPLSFVLTPPRCFFYDPQGYLDSEVLFAGLAPGYYGIYQLSLRLPAALSLSESTLRCETGAEMGDTTNLSIALPTWSGSPTGHAAIPGGIPQLLGGQTAGEQVGIKARPRGHPGRPCPSP